SHDKNTVTAAKKAHTADAKAASKYSELDPSAQPAPANPKHQGTQPSNVSTVKRTSGIRTTPAGIEMNERTTGVSRPRKTAASPKRSNQRSARASFARSRWNQRPRSSSSGRPAYAPIPQPS